MDAVKEMRGMEVKTPLSQILSLNRDAMKRAPEALRMIPFYDIEGLLGTTEHVNSQNIGDGVEALGFRVGFDIGKPQAYLKLFFNSSLLPDKAGTILTKLAPSGLKYSTVDDEVDVHFHGESDSNWLEYINERIINQATAYSIGHRTVPDTVPALLGVLTNGTNYLGIITEFVDGDTIKAVEAFRSDSVKSAVEKLQERNVVLDDIRGPNYIREPDGNIYLIDLTYKPD